MLERYARELVEKKERRKADTAAAAEGKYEMVYVERKVIKFRSLYKATQDSYAPAWKYLSQLQHLKIKDISSPTFLPFARSRLAQGGEKMVCKRDGSAILVDYF